MKTGKYKKSFRRKLKGLFHTNKAWIFKNLHLMILVTSFMVFLLVVLILPLVNARDFSFNKITISELSGQHAISAFLINILLTLLSLGSLIAAWKYYTSHFFQRFFLLIFCISLTSAAFFNHTPSFPDIIYMQETGWHQFFIGTCTLSFIILSISTGIIAGSEKQKSYSYAAGTMVLLLTVMMSEFDKLKGIWQRLIYLIMFGWLIYISRSVKVKNKDNLN